MSDHKHSTFLDRLERRKAGRVRCSQTHCQLGPIADLSRDGCRVISKKALKIPPTESVVLHVRVAGIEVILPAQQVSCRVRKDGKHDIGLRFVGVPDASRRELINLLRSALSTTDHLERMSA